MSEGKMSAEELYDAALSIWDGARATLESGDRSDLARQQIEQAFDMYEEHIATLQREADGMRQALVEHREFWRNRAHGFKHYQAWADLEAMTDAALNGSPQATAEKGSE